MGSKEISCKPKQNKSKQRNTKVNKNRQKYYIYTAEDLKKCDDDTFYVKSAILVPVRKYRRKWHPLKAVKGLFAKKKVKPVKVKELATQEKLCL